MLVGFGGIAGLDGGSFVSCGEVQMRGRWQYGHRYGEGFAMNYDDIRNVEANTGLRRCVHGQEICERM